MSLSEESPPAAVSCGGEIMLFGVRVKVDPMRKSVSMNNLSEYEPLSNTSNLGEKSGKELPKAAQESGGAVEYASADDAVPQQSGGSGERKRGTPWTEEEHKLFLIGLQKVGKGDWRGISRIYVKTRTPTQVASHAQKYFLRRSNINRRRRRSSLFDITTDSVAAMPMEEARNCLEIPAQPATHPASVPLPVTSNVNVFSAMSFPVTINPVLLSMQGGNQMENSAIGQNFLMSNNSSAMLIHHVPVLAMPSSSAMADLNLSQQVPPEASALSLGLSLSTGQNQSLTRDSAFQVISSFKNGDRIVSVA
ncbi:Homeodomain-like superfamily protein [Perilla frutescens var. hirtella]|nr:Homeodomain-like superfamily protein [Perilla frutescens var. hirtella]